MPSNANISFIYLLLIHLLCVSVYFHRVLYFVMWYVIPFYYVCQGLFNCMVLYKSGAILKFVCLSDIIRIIDKFN